MAKRRSTPGELEPVERRACARRGRSRRTSAPRAARSASSPPEAQHDLAHRGADARSSRARSSSAGQLVVDGEEAQPGVIRRPPAPTSTAGAGAHGGAAVRPSAWAGASPRSCRGPARSRSPGRSRGRTSLAGGPARWRARSRRRGGRARRRAAPAPGRVHADAVVDDAQLDVLAEVAARRSRRGRAAALLEAVADGVLDQRLQREHRHDVWRTSGAISHAHLEAVAEARLLEAQVLLDVLELVGERHVGRCRGTRSA